MALPWFRRLVNVLSPINPGFGSGPVNVGIYGDKKGGEIGFFQTTMV